MLLFIHGEDSYSVRERVQETLLLFNKTHGQAGHVTRFGADEVSWDTIATSLTGTGLFERAKLVILTGVLGSKDLRDPLTDFIDSGNLASSTTLAVVEYGVVDKRLSLTRMLLEKATVQECLLPDPRQVEQFISAHGRSIGAEFEPQAARALAERVGQDLWRARLETEKLSHLSSRVTVDDVQRHTLGSLEEAIWSFVDSLSSHNKSRALTLLERQLTNGVEPLYLLSMVVRQIRLLLALKNAQGSDAELARAFKLHPFVVQKTRREARAFSEQELATLLRALARLDAALKTGKGDPKLLFTILIDTMVRS